MQHPRHLRPPMNLHYSNHIVTVQSIARLPLPRPFALASAFGFATAPVFHAAAPAAPTNFLSLAQSIALLLQFPILENR